MSEAIAMPASANAKPLVVACALLLATLLSVLPMNAASGFFAIGVAIVRAVVDAFQLPAVVRRCNARAASASAAAH